MRVFIAGARSLKTLDDPVQKKMRKISQKGYDVLVGDCYGVDVSVQRFYHELGYNKVTIYASNGNARNNVGNWQVQAVKASTKLRGFEFYKQKDIAMADEADCGFMIWDGQSRGTLNNIINLVYRGKVVLVYYVPKRKMVVLRNSNDLNILIDSCSQSVKALLHQTHIGE